MMNTQKRCRNANENTRNFHRFRRVINFIQLMNTNAVGRYCRYLIIHRNIFDDFFNPKSTIDRKKIISIRNLNDLYKN